MLRKFLIVMFILTLVFMRVSFAQVDNVDSSPNYLIIMVHGIISNKEAFDQTNGLKYFLEEELDLEGYVYDFAYSFSDNRGSIINQAGELGNSSHTNPSWAGEMPSLSNGGFWEGNAEWSKIYNNHSWISQSKEYFKAWFKWQNPSNPTHRDPTASEIPQKVVLICHSMGGLAARYYITSDFYQNDVLRMITLDTPHTGSDVVCYLSKYYSLENLGKNLFSDEVDREIMRIGEQLKENFQNKVGEQIGSGLVSNFGGFLFSIPTVDDIYRDSASWVVGLEKMKIFTISNNLPAEAKDLSVVPAFSSTFLELIRYLVFSGEGLDQLNPGSTFINDLKGKDIASGSDEISFRLVSARGAPTPHKDYIQKYYLTTPYITQRLLPYFSEYQGMSAESQKYWALLSSMMLPGLMAVKDGSIVVSVDSSRGEGVELFSRHDTKYYDVMFRDETFEDAMQYIKVMYYYSLAAYTTAQLFSPGLPADFFFVPVKIQLMYISLTLTLNDLTKYDSPLLSHIYIPTVVKDRKNGEPSVIEKALDDIPLFGGTTSTEETTTSGITAMAVGSPTASFNDFDKAFRLLSNLDREGNVVETYHTVTIEAITEASSDSGMAFPIELDGKKVLASAVTVKEAPSAVKGVINTYLPQKLNQFQYSENFAAWKNVGEVDRWGNFTIKDLQLAEGQNVIAFRAETWTGNKSNQHLKIIVNSIPMVPSELSPLPGTYTNNPRPAFSGKFAKAAYSEDPLEEVSLQTAKLIMGELEIDVTGQINTRIEGGDYDKHMWFDFTPDDSLTDGDYTLVVVANSNVGISQAVMTITIDTQAPTIAMGEIKPYSPRAPTTIRYTASDEASPNLKDVRCVLTNNQQQTTDNVIAIIATAESLSKGENFFTWDGAGVSDGTYKVKITASDLAGNSVAAEQPIIIDSTPPTVLSAKITPQPMTSDSSKMGLTAKVDEKATVIIKLNNLSKNETSAYLTHAAAPDGSAFLASQTWQYDNTFSQGPEDGIYQVEVVAQDEAGNESPPRTLEAIRIDRTPPVVYGQIAQPYVLANSGANAYKTTLTFNVGESNDVADNKGKEIGLKVKLYNTNTGQHLDTWELSTERSLTFNGSGSKYAKGAYRFQVVATDNVGNAGIGYASCVKDGIAPVISYPSEDGTDVSGTISIRGTAIDPDWTNDLPFKQYRVYYKSGESPLPLGEGLGVRELESSNWLTAAVEVPLLNRGSSSVAKNISLRPLQNDSTLAYLHSNLLENGEHTILVIADEERGESIVATRIINVYNEEGTTSATDVPYVKLKSMPADVTFKTDDSVKLPIGFINSVKPANVYVEVIHGNSTDSDTDETRNVVFFKYFPNILGAPFIGQPEYQAGGELGYFIWSDDDGYHVRWSADDSSHQFTGSIILVGSGSYSDLKQHGGGIKVQPPLISWDTTLSGSEGGIDFKLDSGQLMITAKIDEDPDSPSIYAENVYLGVSKYSQDFLPIMIDVAGQRLINMANMGGQVAEAESANLERSTQTVDWTGRLDSGAYVDSGAYIIKVRAEGADGVGVAVDEKVVNITTPYDFAVTSVSPSDKEFSTIGAPDRISVYYAVSKDSIINANVYNSSGQFVAKVLEGEEVLGVHPNNPYSLSWLGNYPEPDSGTMVDPGSYRIVLNVASKDGRDSDQAEVSGVRIKSFSVNTSQANVEPVGQDTSFNEGTIKLATGDSPLFIEAKGIGTYHPPKDFTYTLTASGQQKITAYPYVPFTGLMHRGFRQVDTKAKVKFKIHAWNWQQGKHEDIRVFGYKVGEWYNPFAWDLKYRTLNKERWIDAAVFRSGSETGNYTFEFDPNDWWHQSETDNFWSKANPGSGINRIDVQAQIFSKDGSISLDVTPDDKWTLPAADIVTSKGIFKVTNNGEKFTTNHGTLVTGGHWHNKSYGAYRVRLTLELEDKVARSRLTNRFVPWVDFINAKTAESARTKDFRVYLTDINRGLGFPGKLFFEDPAAKPGAPYQPKAQLIAELKGKNWNDLVTELDKKGEEANLVGYKGSLASSVGYTSYLSDEYFEFIPITKPAGGDFQYSDSPVVKVYTNLVYKSDGNPQSPCDIGWPLTDSEISAFNGQQNTKRADLKANPQNYTGTSVNGTWWQLDGEEIAQRKKDKNNTAIGSGKVIYDKSAGKSIWQASQSHGQLLPVPAYVRSLNYSVASNTASIKVYPASGGKNTFLKAEDTNAGLPWSTDDDTTLLAAEGKVKSGPVTFNLEDFRSRRELKIADFYDVSDDYTSASALKYTLLKDNPFKASIAHPIDNPNIELTDWQVVVKDQTGSTNQDVLLDAVETTSQKDVQSHYKNDKIKLRLKLKASEARFVEITGVAPGSYELMYFDGQDWKTIERSNSGKNGRLAWWDVSRLNGKHTVLLKSNGLIATQDVYIGTLVPKSGGNAWSAYKRAQLRFPTGAFLDGSQLAQDQLVTVTPVTMTEIKVRNRPIILTHGPIVEIKPSPWKFSTDKKPTLRFLYTLDDLEELAAYDRSTQGMPSVGQNLDIPWNIHQVTSGGDLQIVDNNQQVLENNNGEYQYVFYAQLDHFSTYTLLDGKFKLSAPIVFASRYITNQETVTIYGTAEPDSIVTVYMLSGEEKDRAAEMKADAKGNFKFDQVGPLQEGRNYIYVTSHLASDDSVETFSDLVITKDTLPPDLEANTKNYAFSPNGDGKFDEIEYRLRSNEKGKLNFMLNDAENKSVYVKEIEMVAYEEAKLIWKGDVFDLFRRNQETGLWEQESSIPATTRIADGSYFAQIFGFDEAGNVSENITHTLVLDTIPPTVENMASVEKFSPDNNGKFDSMEYAVSSNELGRIYYELQKPDSSLLFKNEVVNEADKELKFTWDQAALEISDGDSLNDLIPYYPDLPDGTYLFEVIGVDMVENRSPPMTAEVIVDLTPPEILTFSATPEYFSPNNNGIIDTTMVSYSLNENAGVSLEVSSGSERFREVSKGYNLETQDSWVWDGRAGDGIVVPDGIKRIMLFAEDEVGNAANSSQKDKDIFVTVDTVPPVCTVAPNLYAFSPNGDGKFDTVDYELKSNEIGEAAFQILDIEQLFTGPVNENEAIKINWVGPPLPLGEGPGVRVLDDLYEYRAHSTDRAGNKSEIVTGPIEIDTTPPITLSVAADPNPFTPNSDGVKDTTTFIYGFSEPAYVTTKVFRDDNELFRKHEGPSENFIYPTEGISRESRENQGVSGGWTWDGRGSRNELLGGEYTWTIYAEDWVGNPATAETQTIIVDRITTLIPYAYAEPDPFAPVNPNNAFTEITYYLAREGLKVKVWIVGQEGRPLKTLVRDEIKSKGEHTAFWDGSFDTGYEGPTASRNELRVADGSYEFVVYAEDPNEADAKPAEVSNTVLVDNVPPHVLVKGLAVDYSKKQTTLTYSIPETSTVEVAVYDSEGSLIAELITAEAQSGGEHTLIYDFTNWTSEIGQGYFTIAATDRAKNRDEITTGVFAIVPNPFQIVNAAAVPATFTPNGDGHTDQTKVAYTISGGEPDYAVTIDILSPTGSTVKRLIENETQTAGNYSFYWTGLNEETELVSDGSYEYLISAEDKLGEKIEGRGSILIVSTRPTVDIATNIPVFSPNNDESKDVVTFNYSVDYPVRYLSGEALVKIEILNSSNEAVWEKIFNHTAGTYAYEYDGLTADEVPLSAGSYYVKINAEDELGTTAVPEIVDLQVDYELAQLSGISISPDPFSPAVSSQLVISFALSKDSRISLDVMSDEEVIRNVASDQFFAAYAASQAQGIRTFAIPTITWDGKDNDGDLVSDGDYTVNFSATDEAGNTTILSQDVEVDQTKPEIPVVEILPGYTNEATVIVIGTAEAEGLVRLYINDESVGTAEADSAGDFTTSIPLVSGDNQIKATVKDAASNVSNDSLSQAIMYETEGPQVVSLEVTPNPAKAGDLTILFVVSETLEADPIVTINGNQADKEQQAGNSYEYIYNVAESDQQGQASIKIKVSDLAHNPSISQSNNLLSIDTIDTTISNVGISPLYAKLGAVVTVDFSVSEELIDEPVVLVGNKTAAQESKTVYSSDRIDYSYSYTIEEDDADGATVVNIEVSDLANNPTISQSNNLVIDQTFPAVSDVIVDPNPASVPAVSGQTSIKFNVSEVLQEVPKVYVTQNGAEQRVAIVSGDWDQAGGECEALIDVITGFDGAAQIEIETIDLAENETTQQFDRLVVDTITPVITDIRSEIASNPEFDDFAKEGSEVTIQFNVSEDLKFNPDVRINGNSAAYDGLSAGEYTYKYTVSSTDTEGNATISISGFDLALNEGVAETNSAAEGFVIDLENPTVAISEQPDLIANPGNFSTNANPDGSDRPRSTTFYYGLAEESKVTVKVHKVADAQTTYVKEDFHSGNLVATRVDSIWQDGEVQLSVAWDGAIENNQALYDTNNDGYSDSGKYAFIVEGRDRAGNLTLKKWGGTVWIQDNVLGLREPEQFEYQAAGLDVSNNPDPSIISPNGNSTAPAQKQARFYFMIDLSLDPEQVELPERIEAAEVIADTKKVGFYSVKVYSDSGLTNLVRTIVTGADAQSGTLTWEDWDGKDDAGQFVAEGIYYLAINVEDFAGNPAVDNLMTRQVVVDNTQPVLAGLSVSNDFFAPGATNSAKKTTTIAYTASDNLSAVAPAETNTLDVTIDILMAGVFQTALVSGSKVVDAAGVTFDELWSGEGCGDPGTDDGTYTYRITAVDLAGNSYSDSGTAVVDRVNPADCSIEIKRSDGTASEYTKSESVNLALSATDTNLEDMHFINESGSWGSDDWETYSTSKSWTLTAGDAEKTVYVRYRDMAGNWSEISDTIAFDTTSPTAPILSDDETAWSNNSIFSVDWTNPAQIYPESPIMGIYYQLDGGAVQYTTDKPFNITATAQAGQILKLWLKDEAENSSSANYAELNLRYDGTRPGIPGNIRSTPAANTNGWIKESTATIAWNAASDSGGSGPCTYIGTLDDDNVDHATPKISGWSISGLSEGSNVVRVWAKDGAGNISSSPAIRALNVDTNDPGINPALNSEVNAQGWITTGDISVTLTTGDDRSGVATRKYRWDITPPRLGFGFHIWSDFFEGIPITQNTNGTWYLLYIVTDSAGNSVVDYFGPYRKDDEHPTVEFGGPTPDVWYSPDTAITISCLDAGGSGYQGYKWQWDSWPSTEPAGCNIGPSGTTYHPGQGTNTLYVRAWDNAGNRTDEERTYMRDDTPPNVGATPELRTWDDTNISVELSVSDTHSDIKNSYYQWTTSTTTPAPTSDWISFSDGQTKTQSSDGEWYLHLKAEDNAGKTVSTHKGPYRKDAQYPYVSVIPAIIVFNPYTENGTTINFTAYDQGPSNLASLTATITFGTTVIKDLTVSGGGNDKTVTWDGTNGADPPDYVNEGFYYLAVVATDNAGNSFSRGSIMILSDDQRVVYDRQRYPLDISLRIERDNQLWLKWSEGRGGYPWHFKEVAPEYENNIEAAPIQDTQNGIDEKLQQQLRNGYYHGVVLEQGKVYYRRSSYNNQNWVATVPIYNAYNGVDALDPVLYVDSSNNAYIAWVVDKGNYPDEIYFQKVPSNFAPVSTNADSRARTAAIIGPKVSAIATPILISPASEETVTTLRPTFKWKHQRGAAVEYNVDVAENDSFTLFNQTYKKSANTGSPIEVNSDIYNYIYSIDEFDPGLDRDTYYWRVSAHSTNEAATSEARSFTVAPEMTISGVTNYPNPFNPNSQTTSIRYRLGADADSVKIRIYDITGSLVRELDGATAGELSSIWNKYNDVSWDGKNGRGDKVVNGIYPFEIVAKLGSRSVSGRGKIAVLK
ncbi:FlgD immunoglobulin-like domain containing protein [Candidatus Margulisiibacteriota bacterium]